MHRGEVKRFDRCLQNIELGAERYVRSQTNTRHSRCSPGASVMDSVAPGEVLIVFADGRKRGGVGVANPRLELLEESASRAAVLTAAAKRRTLIDTAVALRPCNRPDAADKLLAVANDILIIAGLLLDASELELLSTVRNAVPALAIIALTDTRGRPTVETRHLVTRFPGRWLGTRSPAGSA